MVVMTINIEDKSNVISLVQEAVARHGTSHEALVPVLTEVNQALGYLPVDALTEISRSLRLSDSQLFSVASFYRMLSTRPRGKHVIQFCESAPCHVTGGREVWQALHEALELEPGETSADGQWTLLKVSCPGLCGVAPVVVIDDEIYGNVVPKQVPEILARYEPASFAPGSGRNGDKGSKGGN
jgi:NADH:ubiquinone oxidoreductase subunit E